MDYLLLTHHKLGKSVKDLVGYTFKYSRLIDSIKEIQNYLTVHTL